ncbi:hypothetical protein HQN90_10800 [Paenibacillus alba]|nr:hypothetical protein [Paenibacillus alba]
MKKQLPLLEPAKKAVSKPETAKAAKKNPRASENRRLNQSCSYLNQPQKKKFNHQTASHSSSFP